MANFRWIRVIYLSADLYIEEEIEVNVKVGSKAMISCMGRTLRILLNVKSNPPTENRG